MLALPLLLEHHVYQKPTIVVLLDIRASFVSFDKSALMTCVLESGVPEKYGSILKIPYRQTLGRVKVCEELPPSFAVPSGVRQGYSVFPVLLSFVMDDQLRRAFGGVVNCGVKFIPGQRVVDLGHTD